MTKVRTYRIDIDENAQQWDAIVFGTCGWMTSQHLGTAASLDAWTCAGNVPILDANWNLPNSTTPTGVMKKCVYDPNGKNADVYDYCNFDNTPEIPVVNDPTVTFTQGWITVWSISLNQSGNTTISLLAGWISAWDWISINNNIASVNYDDCSLCIDNCKLSVKDYNTIASWAAAWATAIQPNDLCTTCDLQNYYLKCETYQKCEVDTLISNFWWFEVVSVLPSSDIKTNVIYLLWPIWTGNDKYEEWIYYNNTWTKIWETTTDLSNYAKCCDIPTDNCQLWNSCWYTTCTGTLVSSDLNPYAKSCTLCTVATSWKYCDLTWTPTIPAALSAGNGVSITSNCINVNYDWSTIKKNDWNCLYADLTGYVLATSLADVATSWKYCDLTGAPDLSWYQTTNNMVCTLSWADDNHYPSAKAVADALSCAWAWDMLSSVYDPCNKNSNAFDYCNFINTPSLCSVATSWLYCDLSGAPDLSCKQDVLILWTNLHYDTNWCLQVGDSNNDLQWMRYVCTSYLKTSSWNMTWTPTAIPVLDASGWMCKQTPACFLSNLGIKTVATSWCYCDLTGTPILSTVATSWCYCDLTWTPTIPTDNCQLTNSCGYTTCTGTLVDSSLVTINWCCLVGSWDICIQWWVTSVNWCTWAVNVCEVPSWWSCWQVLQKTANWCDWATISLAAWDMCYADYNWSSKSWATVTLSLNSTITPSANFTVDKPSTIKEWQIYTLRVNNWSTAYTMSLGTGISNPWGTDLTLTPSGTDQFVFLATSSSTLELQNDVDDEVRFVTQDEYNALPATKETDGRAYFIVEEAE